jgi:hypothetical protein
LGGKLNSPQVFAASRAIMQGMMLEDKISSKPLPPAIPHTDTVHPSNSEASVLRGLYILESSPPTSSVLQAEALALQLAIKICDLQVQEPRLLTDCMYLAL